MWNSSIIRGGMISAQEVIEEDELDASSVEQILQKMQPWADAGGDNRVAALGSIRAFLNFPDEEGSSGVLALRGLGLSSLPENIDLLARWLVALDLDGNALGTPGGIPVSLKNCQNLTKISLSNNDLSEVPEVLAEMREQITLDLSNNRLQSVDLSCIPNVAHLDLSNNSIRTMFGSAGALLGTLNLGENPICCFENASNLLYLRSISVSLSVFSQLPLVTIRDLLSSVICVEINSIPGLGSVRVETESMLRALLEACEEGQGLSADRLEQLMQEENGEELVIEGDLSQVAAYFFEMAELEFNQEVWQSMTEHSYAQPFTQLLSRLLQTAPFYSEDTLDAQCTLVCQTLDALSKDQTLFQAMCAVAEEGLGACGDRVSLTWSDIQIRTAASVLGQSGEVSASDLVNFGIGVLRQQTLDYLAHRNSMQDHQRNFQDRVERQMQEGVWVSAAEYSAGMNQAHSEGLEYVLAYRVMLAESLALPLPIPKMLHGVIVPGLDLVDRDQVCDNLDEIMDFLQFDEQRFSRRFSPEVFAELQQRVVENIKTLGDIRELVATGMPNAEVRQQMQDFLKKLNQQIDGIFQSFFVEESEAEEEGLRLRDMDEVDELFEEACNGINRGLGVDFAQALVKEVLDQEQDEDQLAQKLLDQFSPWGEYLERDTRVVDLKDQFMKELEQLDMTGSEAVMQMTSAEYQQAMQDLSRRMEEAVQACKLECTKEAIQAAKEVE